MTAIAFDNLTAPPRRLWPAVVALGAALLAGGIAVLVIETQGHHVTGMTNRVPWGLPHVVAYFLILSASGALNVAMVASVFRQKAYEPLAPFSALLAIALLAGGLSILVLDLGRPDRLTLTMQSPNPRSIFAWNVVLYTGFVAITAAYLVTLLDRRFARFLGVTSRAAFLWRFVLTTGTGLDLGILIAREEFNSAIFAPMFISFSLTYGLAVFLLLLPAAAWLSGGAPDRALMQRLGRLLSLFLAVSFYLSAVTHVFNLYAPPTRALERFLLFDGGLYTALFWGGQVFIGTVAPLLLVYRGQPIAAAAAVVLGALATLYLYVIVSQAFPQPVLPGQQVTSSWGDGMVASYVPSTAEFFLGLGSVSVALAALLAGCLLFRIVPVDLARAAAPRTALRAVA
ncbi:MAG: NrfD/PsrC family molybdoenzyme membrane anchor subunit [Xanthobacteraceae bacterium]